MSKWKQLEFELDELKKSYSNLAQQNKKLIVENHNLKTQIKQKDDLINKLQDDLFITSGVNLDRLVEVVRLTIVVSILSLIVSLVAITMAVI